MERQNDRAVLTGIVAAPPSFSHSGRNGDYLAFPLEVERLSGTVDTLNIIALRALAELEGERNIRDTRAGSAGQKEQVIPPFRYVIVGTNFDHRVISEKVFQAYIDEMNKKEILGCIIIENYMLFYDSTKLFNVDGENYLIGSFLLVKLAETGDSAYLWLSEDDIEEAKEDISGYFAELIINGERYEALCVG